MRFEAEVALHVEDADQPRGAGVENDRQQDPGIGDQENQVGDDLGLVIEADLQVLRHGRHAAAQEARQEEQRHAHQCDDGHDLPDHDGKTMGKGGAVEPDHLLGGEVGQEQGAGDQRPGQAATGEENALAGGMVIPARQPPGERGHQGGEEQEGGQDHRIRGRRSTVLIDARKDTVRWRDYKKKPGVGMAANARMVLVTSAACENGSRVPMPSR